MNDLKDEILKLYFIDKLKQKDIANKLQVSKYIISRTVSKDCRYQDEKERRKQENKAKNREATIKYMNNKRKSNETEYYYMKMQHQQDIRELSGAKKSINNRAYRNWNSSAYRYNKKTKSYILRDDITAGFDVPKKISWK